MRMSTRVALVTGGIGELGRSICERLTRQGCRVAALDIALTTNGDDGRSWQARLAGEGLDVMLIAGDVTDFDACASAVANAESELGPVDILVNCAGITRDASLGKLDKNEWDAVLSTNLDSVFNVTKHVIDGMTQRGFGRVVNISSLNGVKGQFGQTNYSAAKAGMHGFTMALAREVARKGVTVNTVSPGYMNTKMVGAVPREILDRIVAEIPVGRLGDTREIAALVAFLCSDESAFITGANYSINGGHHMH
jgi:acetoacetyl-CoA reductase